MKSKKAAIFLNPMSGGTSWKNKIKIAKKAAKKIRKFTNTAVIIYTNPVNSRGEFQKLLKKESGKYDYVIVGGGDGAFNDALNYTPDRVTLGFIPLGTGNALKFALDNYKTSNKECYVDVIVDKKDNKKCFFYGIGMDGFVTEHSERLRARGYNGPIRYIASVLVAALGRFKPVDFRIEKDGYLDLSIDRSSFCFIGKHPFMGLGISMLPRANFDDGQLHCQVAKISLFNLVPQFIKAALRKDDIGYRFSAQNLKIKTSYPVYSQMDGDLVRKSDSFELHLLKSARKILPVNFK